MNVKMSKKAAIVVALIRQRMVFIQGLDKAKTLRDRENQGR